MKNLHTKDFISRLDLKITEFEHIRLNEKSNDKSLGIVYTPNEVVEFMVSKIFKLYFEELYKMSETKDLNSLLGLLQQMIINDGNFKRNLVNKVRTIKILDPACGSGRFLISVAEVLYRFYRILNLGLEDFDIKRNIIQHNLFGNEIEEPAYLISQLRLIAWLFLNNEHHLNHLTIDVIKLDSEEISHILKKMDIRLNLFNLDFLFNFNLKNFEIIVGNPPYIENKKINDREFKKKLKNNFQSAYRLFDLSIIFIERSLELLHKQEGYLSMITTNKFLAADYGIKIREILLNNTELKEIIDISSLPIFRKTAAYPIIISLKNSAPKAKNVILIKEFSQTNSFTDNSNIKTQILPQDLISRIPAFVFPITGQIKLINYLYNNFKPFKEAVSDLQIHYRPFGFTNWSKHLDKARNNKKSKTDLLLIGTGNVGKYYILFDKQITIAKKAIPISYLHYQQEFRKIWKEFSNQKLIFREIAKELTWVYDPGIYTNVTGLYFVRIPSFNQEKLFSLLVIMNSKLMDIIFKTLFSSLHMAGNYLRFNGSFIKRLPLPRKFPKSLANCGKILQLLSQLQYDFESKYCLGDTKLLSHKHKYQKEITDFLHLFNRISNALVFLLYLDDLYIKSNRNYDVLRDFLDHGLETAKIHFKYLVPRFNINKFDTFSPDELPSRIDEIRDYSNNIRKNRVLLRQIEDILNDELPSL
jgi:hypothetical protein